MADVGSKVLPWARVFQPLILVADEDDLLFNASYLASWGDGWNHGDGEQGNGRGSGETHAMWRNGDGDGEGNGEWGFRDGDGHCDGG